MATITTETLDARERVLYFRQVGQNALEKLPFELVTIDQDFQAYEPVMGDWKDSNGRKRRGKIMGMVILGSNQAIPQAPREERGQFAVWEFQGR